MGFQQELRLSFNEEIQIGMSGEIRVWKVLPTNVLEGHSDAELREVIQFSDVESVGITGSGNHILKIQLSPLTLDQEYTTYAVEVDSGFVRDTAFHYANNDWSGMRSPLADPSVDARPLWTFTTQADVTAPVILSTTPSQGAVGVIYGFQNLAIRFDEPVQVSVGSIKAVAAKSGTIGELQDYYLLIDATCFKDSVQSPNFFSGLSQPSEWWFTTQWRSHMELGAGSKVDIHTGYIKFTRGDVIEGNGEF